MAIFIIVVFSMMAAVLAKIISTSSENISYEVLGTRAYAAAKTGNEWALQQLFPLKDIELAACEENISDYQNISSKIVPDLSSLNGLQGCWIDSLACVEFSNDSVDYFTITSTGVCQQGSVTTSRTLQVEARSL